MTPYAEQGEVLRPYHDAFAASHQPVVALISDDLDANRAVAAKKVAAKARHSGWANGLIGAPTWQALQERAVPAFIAALNDFHVPHELEAKKRGLWILDPRKRRRMGYVAFAALYPQDNAQAWRMLELGWAWVDDAAKVAEHHMLLLASRLRQTAIYQHPQILLTSQLSSGWAKGAAWLARVPECDRFIAPMRPRQGALFTPTRPWNGRYRR